MRKSREHSQDTKSVIRQGLGIVTAGSLAILAVIASAGGGDKAKKYDIDNEAALQHAIRPTMVRIARQVTKSAVIAPGPIDERYRSEQGITTIITGYPDYPRGDFGHVTVVTGVKPGTSLADPQKVKSVRIGGISRNEQSGGVIALTAPGAELDPLPFPYDKTGWTAAEGHYFGVTTEKVKRYLNSADPDHLMGAALEVGDPVAIARQVVSDATQASSNILSAR